MKNEKADSANIKKVAITCAIAAKSSQSHLHYCFVAGGRPLLSLECGRRVGIVFAALWRRICLCRKMGNFWDLEFGELQLLVTKNFLKSEANQKQQKHQRTNSLRTQHPCQMHVNVIHELGN